MKTIKRRIIWGAVLVFILCCVYTFLYFNGLSFQYSLSSTPQANITLIPGPVIATPDYNLLFTVTPTPTLDPLSPESSGIRSGSYVQIMGTGGSGLNIRNSADLSGEKKFIASESEVFLVIGGPIVKDDHTWWQLSAPYDDSRQGWAVEDYLHLIEP